MARRVTQRSGDGAEFTITGAPLRALVGSGAQVPELVTGHMRPGMYTRLTDTADTGAADEVVSVVSGAVLRSPTRMCGGPAGDGEERGLTIGSGSRISG